MAFYAFRLDMIDVKNPRGKIPDSDVVTFGVLVNQQDRGNGAGYFPAMGAGSRVPAAAVIPNVRNGLGRDWIIGPLEIAPGDSVHVVYSGTNTSDSQLDLSGQAEIEIKILNAMLGAAVGAPGGDIGAAITTVLSWIGDPVGKFLGFKKHGPCNGPVFSDAVPLIGSGLDNLPFQPPPVTHPYVVEVLPGASEISFTRAYTDEANHNTDVCGAVAHTEVTFSILQVPSISVGYYARRLFPVHLEQGKPVPDFAQGLRQLVPGGEPWSLRSLLRLRP